MTPPPTTRNSGLSATDVRCDCGKVLTAEERHYYGHTCEACERAAMGRGDEADRQSEIEQMRAHDARVTELLEANNREVERRRAAEATVANLRAMLLRIEREGVPQPAPDEDQITALAGRIVDQLAAVGRPTDAADPVKRDRAEKPADWPTIPQIKDAYLEGFKDGVMSAGQFVYAGTADEAERYWLASDAFKSAAPDALAEDQAEWDKEKRW